jgi:Zn finger protein HypA/HybF involved in hydrogenase expression
MDEAEMARTESAFREVNEAIATTAAKFEADETDFVCECADPECAHRITAALDDYEAVRCDATHFIIAPGHEEPEIERIVARNGEFTVVEKFGAQIQRIVRSLNPRAKTA